MKITILLVLAITVLSGCANSLNNSAKHVRILSDISKGCKFVSQVNGSQGNSLTGSLTTRKNLINGARNELRNNTNYMGGNAVLIIKTDEVSYNGDNEISVILLTGNAYFCK